MFKKGSKAALRRERKRLVRRAYKRGKKAARRISQKGWRGLGLVLGLGLLLGIGLGLAIGLVLKGSLGECCCTCDDDSDKTAELPEKESLE